MAEPELTCYYTCNCIRCGCVVEGVTHELAFTPICDECRTMQRMAVILDSLALVARAFKNCAHSRYAMASLFLDDAEAKLTEVEDA